MPEETGDVEEVSFLDVEGATLTRKSPGMQKGIRKHNPCARLQSGVVFQQGPQ